MALLQLTLTLYFKCSMFSFTCLRGHNHKIKPMPNVNFSCTRLLVERDIELWNSLPECRPTVNACTATVLQCLSRNVEFSKYLYAS